MLGAARVATTDFDQNGGDVHMGQVLDAVAAASVDAGLSADRIPVAELGVYCLAGADFPVDDRRIARWLRIRQVTDERLVRNDTFAVLRAGTDRAWGVGVVCGYGINCSGVAPDGRITRFPAVGPISGDWGGGNDIGEAALWHAIRAEDGRGRQDRAASDVPAALRLPATAPGPDGHVLRPDSTTTGSRSSRRWCSSRGPRATRSRARIIDRQADEVVALAATAIRRLRMTRLDVDVVLGRRDLPQRRRGLLRPDPRRRRPGRRPRGDDHASSPHPPVIGAARWASTASAPPERRSVRAARCLDP